MVFQVSHAIHEPYSSITEDKLWLPDHKGIRLSGNLSDATGKGVSEARLIMSEPGPGTDLESSITNEKGDFSFLLGMGTGDKDIIITLPSSEMKVSLEEPFWNGFRKMPDDLILQISAKMIPYLRDKFVHLQLQNRFRNDFYEKIPPFSARRDTTAFYSKPYQTYMIGNYIALDSLAEYFHELIPSVKFVRRRGEVEISVTDPSTMSEIPEKPGVFLDGVPYNNFSGIADIPANEIDRITVIPAVYYYKDFTFGGIIDIHTRKSDFSSVKMLPEMIRFIYPLANKSEWRFVPPDYSEADSPGRIPDFRYLLLWEPWLRVNNSGEATIEFYTGDVKGSFVVKVVGMSDEGEFLQNENEIYIDD